MRITSVIFIVELIAHSDSSSIQGSRGMVVCVGRGMIKKLNSLIFQVQMIWSSALSIAAVHCDELGTADQWEILKNYDNISFLDICPRSSPRGGVFGMERNYSMARLRSFFCKPAALLASPFVETMLVDLDVIWLKKPDVVFSSEDYQRTGTLFFRDRIIMEHDIYHPSSTFQQYLKTFESYVSVEDMKRNSVEILNRKNGSLFWWSFTRHPLFLGKAVINCQDSSVVLFHRHKQHQTLREIRKLLPYFRLGFGDKEIYWVAATIAKMTFSFERFLCGSYGDCGVIMHFDPSQENRAEPLYINGEWLVEGIDSVGSYLQSVASMTIPTVVTKDYKFDEELHKQITKGPSRLFVTGCTCQSMTCQAVPENVTRNVLINQWLSLTAEYSATNQSNKCINVTTKFIGSLHAALRWVPVDRLCRLVGCPRKTSMPQDSNQSEVCVPIDFL
jgi:hypothetical protein